MPRKEKVGIVVSNKMDKTVVVNVEDHKAHPIYKKIIVSTKKYKAHDESNQCNEGDKVRIVEWRPISKDKRWNVVDIIERANVETSDSD
ncbi:MAG: 30S ribosomal protein S17 [Vampirovibrionia bacterium]